MHLPKLRNTRRERETSTPLCSAQTLWQPPPSPTLSFRGVGPYMIYHITAEMRRTLIFHLRMRFCVLFSSGEGKGAFKRAHRAIHNAVCSPPPWNFTWPFVTVLVVFRKKKKKTKKTLKTADLYFCLTALMRTVSPSSLLRCCPDGRLKVPGCGRLKQLSHYCLLLLP